MNLADNLDLRRLYAIRLFLFDCVLPDGYHFPAAMEEAVRLTDAGERIFQQLLDENTSLAPVDAKAAVFVEFFSSGDLLVDYQATNYEDLQAALSPDIANGTIRYPWVFGDVLEAAYIESYGREAREYLPHNETMAVLTRLPQGVFQVADITVGPFGMVKVIQQRCLPPSLCGPEISCSDPGCSGIHHVVFRTGTTDAGTAYESIESPPLTEDMRKLGRDLERPDEQYYRSDNDWGLPWLLMSGLIPSETRGLLAKLLSANTDGIRQFANAHLPNPLPKLSASEISLQVSDAQMCQMLLAVTNECLVNTVEEMIKNGEIEIGRSETRLPIRIRHAEGGAFDTKPEMSRLGMRFHPRPNVALLRLRSFLLQLYKGDAEKELAWLLRDQAGDTNIERLDNYLLSAKPGQVIFRLVLGTRERVLDAFRLMQYGHFELPSNPDSDRELIETILWKLGNDLPAPPSPERRVMDRITLFRHVSTKEKDRTESGIDSIRSAGINMFVEFEALLADVVDYVCWMLLSDHYSSNRLLRFVYRRKVAQQFSRPLLMTRARQGSFEFNADGNNSLGTLIEALRVIASLCEEALGARSDFVRPTSMIPFIDVFSDIYIFPFLHTKLVLDIESARVAAVINTLRSAASELETAGVSSARNGMGHPRSTFPSDEDVVKSCLGIERALTIMQTEGILPTVYTRIDRTTDSFGRISTTMTDGDGRCVKLAGPSEIARSGMPPLNVPQMIATGLHLARSSQPLRLAYVEETRFTELLDAHAPLQASDSTAETDVATPGSDESAY